MTPISPCLNTTSAGNFCNIEVNKLARFVVASAGGTEKHMRWKAGRLAANECNVSIRDGADGSHTYLKNIEDVTWLYGLQLNGGTVQDNSGNDISRFFTDLRRGDAITITLPAGAFTGILAEHGRVSRLEFSEALTDGTGPIADGEAVSISSGATSKSLTVWYRIDDSNIADFQTILGTDTRRAMFIRTRANPAITSDHRVIIDGLEYEVKAIQELANGGEIRIALTRVPDPVILGGPER